ncbi:MAG: endonuclease III [Rickettsiales bacterium]|jgi:endonuclease-3|nr:endonuclease III [Rickettsiales bacterium]
MTSPSEYFEIIGRYFGTGKLTELHYVNEFTLAVSVILSAQATDKKVNEVVPALFLIADTPEKMLALGEDGLKKHIKVISFFNNKAKNILALATILRNEKQIGGKWKFPEKYHKRDELMKLPGIGQKTANVVSNVLWGAPNIGVDTHVFRLSHRFGWVGGADNTPEKVEQKLLKLIPKKYHSVANHLMVMHGRYICRALRPDCEHCPVSNICIAKDKKPL